MKRRKNGARKGQQDRVIGQIRQICFQGRFSKWFLHFHSSSWFLYHTPVSEGRGGKGREREEERRGEERRGEEARSFFSQLAIAGALWGCIS
jgi:hypothetical protein